MNFRLLKYPTPTNKDIEQGAKYCFEIGNDLDYSVEIFDLNSKVLWRCETRPKRSPYSLLNIFSKPDFVVFDADKREILRIRRTKDFWPTFEIVEKEGVRGTIKLRSILKNKYTLEFPAGLRWTFRMPLFSLHYWGVSSCGSHFWARLGRSHREWFLLMEPGTDNIYLLSGLAFIQRQIWCYN